VLPIVALLQISLLVPTLMLGGIVGAYLGVKSGWIPVGVLAAAAAVSAGLLMGGRIALVLLLASLAPSVMVVLGATGKRPFFEQMNAGVIACVCGLMAAMMSVMLLLPCCASGEAVRVEAEIREACIQAGGELLPEARAAKVISPYGTQSVVLRDAPSDSYHPVALLMVGEEITAVGVQGEFVYVLLKDGGMGWLEANEVE
jgi:hypothetical protein